MKITQCFCLLFLFLITNKSQVNAGVLLNKVGSILDPLGLFHKDSNAQATSNAKATSLNNNFQLGPLGFSTSLTHAEAKATASGNNGDANAVANANANAIGNSGNGIANANANAKANVVANSGYYQGSGYNNNNQGGYNNNYQGGSGYNAGGSGYNSGYGQNGGVNGNFGGNSGGYGGVYGGEYNSANSESHSGVNSHGKTYTNSKTNTQGNGQADASANAQGHESGHFGNVGNIHSVIPVQSSLYNNNRRPTLTINFIDKPHPQHQQQTRPQRVGCSRCEAKAQANAIAKALELGHTSTQNYNTNSAMYGSTNNQKISNTFSIPTILVNEPSQYNQQLPLYPPLSPSPNSPPQRSPQDTLEIIVIEEPTSNFAQSG